MRITHHPDASILMTCAAGSQPEVLCAVIASHLSVCPSCMSEVGRLEKIGVALFDGLDPKPLKSKVPLTAANAGDAQKKGWSHSDRSQDDVPPPLTGVIGPRLDDIEWLLLAAGVWHFPIPLSLAAKGDLRLVKMSPGSELLNCGHKGEELALVLRGKCRDELNSLCPGDFADREEGSDCLIVADEALGCTLLIASEHELQIVPSPSQMSCPAG